MILILTKEKIVTLNTENPKGVKNSVNNIRNRLYNELPNNLKSIDDTLHFRKKVEDVFIAADILFSRRMFIYKN
jgi:hypothetical protein